MMSLKNSKRLKKMNIKSWQCEKSGTDDSCPRVDVNKGCCIVRSVGHPSCFDLESRLAQGSQMTTTKNHICLLFNYKLFPVSIDYPLFLLSVFRLFRYTDMVSKGKHFIGPVTHIVPSGTVELKELKVKLVKKKDCIL